MNQTPLLLYFALHKNVQCFLCTKRYYYYEAQLRRVRLRRIALFYFLFIIEQSTNSSGIQYIKLWLRLWRTPARSVILIITLEYVLITIDAFDGKGTEAKRKLYQTVAKGRKITV